MRNFIVVHLSGYSSFKTNIPAIVVAKRLIELEITITYERSKQLFMIDYSCPLENNNK